MHRRDPPTPGPPGTSGIPFLCRYQAGSTYGKIEYLTTENLSLINMPKNCPECGKPLAYPDAEICQACGAQVQPRARPQASPAARPATREARLRNPLVAVALSFLCPGWGQWYNGRRWDGLKFFGAFVIIYGIITALIFVPVGIPLAVTILSAVLGLAALGIWILGMVHAYRTAEQINHGELPFERKSRLFWLPVVLLVILILLLVIAWIFFLAMFGLMTGGAGMGGIEQTKTVAATARQTGDTIFVTWQGGPDNDLVTNYSVHIESSDGQSADETDIPPEVGVPHQFTGGTGGNDHVVVLASFTDGSQQLILDTYV